MAIHPTAVVDPGAEVDRSCEIGPYAVVGPNVRLGPGNVLAAHAIVTGHTTLGEGNRVFPHAVLGEIPQDLKYRGEPTRLEVGDRNTFRECVTVNLGTVQGGGVTAIGNGCLLMAYSHVGHDCRIGDGAIIANSVALAGHVILEDHVHISGLAAAHQFCRIGRLAFVSGLTGVAMDVPPYCTVAGPRAELAGLNTVGLQRAGLSDEQLGRIKQAYKVVFRSNLGLAEAVAQLDADLGAHPEVAHFVAFLRSSQRGVTR
jgi:UDP-N-acetylglucosamine acyltransferase